MTQIKKCTCKHEFQDATYGKDMRVFNIGGKKLEDTHCTVCGTKQPSGIKESKSETKKVGK